MPFIFASHLHDILFVRLLNEGLPWMASARGLSDTERVASVSHYCLLLPFCPGTGQGWYMGGPGLERVWNGMERGLERNGPLQHSTATVARRIFIKFGTFGRKQCSKQFLDCKLAAAKRISTIIQHSSATAGSNYQWYRHKPATG